MRWGRRWPPGSPRPQGLNEVLELGLEVADPGLADLPWEALQVPEASGEVAQAGGSPLVLHRNVALYRLVGGLGTTPAHQVRGPLRLLVAIASPETGDAELLDYEAELARIVAAVEPARKRGEAYVRVLNEGSLAAISAALSEDPEGFHVLHLSCHARPGELLLETAERAAGPGQPPRGCWRKGCRPGPTCRWWCCRAAPPGWRPARSGCTQAPPGTVQAGCGWPAPGAYEAGAGRGRGGAGQLRRPVWWAPGCRRCWRCRRRSPTPTPPS